MTVQTPDNAPDQRSEVGREIRKLEIFRAGRYPQGEFTEADLDTIVASYDPAFHEAPVTLDHDQKGPALGKVKHLWREGRSLFAHLYKVSDALVDAIKRGAFDKRSAEIYRDVHDSDGNSRGKYLKALTFLGAAAPQVKGMAGVDVGAIFNERGPQEFVSIEVRNDLQFREVTSPDSGAHGIIVSQGETGEMMGHWHSFFLDENGDGFTSPPISFDEDRGGFIREEGGHQHLIKAKKIQPAGNTQHEHKLTFIETMSETGEEPESKEEPTMPKNEGAEATKTISFEEHQAQVKTFEEQIAAQDEKIEGLQKTVKEQAELQKTMAASFAEERLQIKFDKAYDQAIAKGCIDTSDQTKERKFNLFKALGSSESRDAFLEDMTSGPSVFGEKSEPFEPEKFSVADIKTIGGDGVDMDRAIRKHMAENDFESYADAAADYAMRHAEAVDA